MDNNDILDDMDQGQLKERHGCVSAWLIFMVIANAFSALLYLFFYENLMGMMPEESLEQMPDVNPMFLGILGVLNLVFAILLLQWKKVGFWGFVATSVISLALNMNAGMGAIQILLGLVGIVILYGILQIPKEDVAAWKHLE